MQGIYVWIVTSIALGFTGFLIAFSRAMKERRRMLNSLPTDTAESILEDEESPREELSGITLVYATVTAPAFIYTLLGSILVITFGVDTDVHMRIATGALIALGLSCLFANVGRSRIYEEVMNGLNERDGGSQKDIGKYMMFLMLFETPAIFGLLIFQIGLIFSGMLGTGSDLSMQTADMYFYGALIFGFTTASTILMGWIFNKVEGPLNEDIRLFQKKMSYTAMAHLPFVIGLAIAVVMMTESGMMG